MKVETNLDYEKAHEAINLIKSGTDIIDAVAQTNAKMQVVNIMLGNEDIITKDVFVDETIRIFRESLCSSCENNENNTCMMCACPLPAIINMNFKECPIGKW